jgi:hypothetical protein
MAQWRPARDRAVDEGDKPHYKVRLTVADLKEGAQHYVAQLTKNRPIITGTPDSGSDRDLKAAQMGTALWEYWWHPDKQLDQKLQTSVIDATLVAGLLAHQLGQARRQDAELHGLARKGSRSSARSGRREPRHLPRRAARTRATGC